MTRGSPLFSLIPEQYNPSTRSEKSSLQHNLRIFITTQYDVMYIVTETHNLIRVVKISFYILWHSYGD